VDGRCEVAIQTFKPSALHLLCISGTLECTIECGINIIYKLKIDLHLICALGLSFTSNVMYSPEVASHGYFLDARYI